MYSSYLPSSENSRSETGAGPVQRVQVSCMSTQLRQLQYQHLRHCLHFLNPCLWPHGEVLTTRLKKGTPAPGFYAPDPAYSTPPGISVWTSFGPLYPTPSAGLSQPPANEQRLTLSLSPRPSFPEGGYSCICGS